jgi:hypothetical protein
MFNSRRMLRGTGGNGKRSGHDACPIYPRRPRNSYRNPMVRPLLLSGGRGLVGTRVAEFFDRLQSVSSPVADRMRTHLNGSLEGVAVAVFEAVRDDAVELTVIRQILIDAVGNVWLLLGVPRGRARRVDGPSHRTDRNTTRLLCVGVRDRWSLVTRTRTVWRRTSAHRWHESM